MDTICLGKAVKLHGILGAIKVVTQFDADFDINKIDKVYDENGKEYLVIRIFKITDGVVIQLEGINIENAKLLINKMIFIDRMLISGKILYEDLKQSKVYFEDATLVGTIVDVADYGSAEVISVLLVSGRELMFPCIDGIIDSFDYKTKKLIINKQKLLEVSDYED